MGRRGSNRPSAAQNTAMYKLHSTVELSMTRKEALLGLGFLATRQCWREVAPIVLHARDSAPRRDRDSQDRVIANELGNESEAGRSLCWVAKCRGNHGNIFNKVTARNSCWCGQKQHHPVDQRQNKDKKPHRKKFFWQAPLRRQGPSLKELMDLEELASKAYR